jgi:hypothetical protein
MKDWGKMAIVLIMALLSFLYLKDNVWNGLLKSEKGKDVSKEAGELLAALKKMANKDDLPEGDPLPDGSSKATPSGGSSKATPTPPGGGTPTPPGGGTPTPPGGGTPTPPGGGAAPPPAVNQYAPLEFPSSVSKPVEILTGFRTEIGGMITPNDDLRDLGLKGVMKKIQEAVEEVSKGVNAKSNVYGAFLKQAAEGLKTLLNAGLITDKGQNERLTQMVGMLLWYKEVLQDTADLLAKHG